MAKSKRRYLKNKILKEELQKEELLKEELLKEELLKEELLKEELLKEEFLKEEFLNVKNQKNKGRGYIKLFNSNNLIGKEATIQGYGVEYHPYYPGSNITGDNYDTSCEAKVSKAMPMCK